MRQPQPRTLPLAGKAHPVGALKDWWKRLRQGRAQDFADNWFDATVQRVHQLAALAPAERERLRQLAREFLADKHINGVQGVRPDAALRTRIATLAAWPALHLGYEALAGWSELIVYPDSFLAPRSIREDGTGVVHEYHQHLAGEAWSHGPVVLSLADLNHNLDRPERPSNVLVHEIAHKIDGLDGSVNGRPPLHRGMSAQRWAEVFGAAFADLAGRLERHEHSIDPYAATSPEEFFAVTSEYHFLAPHLLRMHYPAVADQLQQFYGPRPA